MNHADMIGELVAFDVDASTLTFRVPQCRGTTGDKWALSPPSAANAHAEAVELLRLWNITGNSCSCEKCVRTRAFLEKVDA